MQNLAQFSHLVVFIYKPNPAICGALFPAVVWSSCVPIHGLDPSEGTALEAPPPHQLSEHFLIMFKHNQHPDVKHLKCGGFCLNSEQLLTCSVGSHASKPAAQRGSINLWRPVWLLSWRTCCRRVLCSCFAVSCTCASDSRHRSNHQSVYRGG